MFIWVTIVVPGECEDTPKTQVQTNIINVVNISYFQSCHFLGYQSFAQSRVAQTSHKGVTTVHSVKDR